VHDGNLVERSLSFCLVAVGKSVSTLTSYLAPVSLQDTFGVMAAAARTLALALRPHAMTKQELGLEPSLILVGVIALHRMFGTLLSRYDNIGPRLLFAKRL
jgi:uncharacterized membrane protein